MARIRSVKPELRTSLTAAEWPREVRYFWVLLWGYLDDHGRGVDEPRLIKADCFPLDDDLTAADIEKWLEMFAEPRDDEPPPSAATPSAAGITCTFLAGAATRSRSTRPTRRSLSAPAAVTAGAVHEPFMSRS